VAEAKSNRPDALSEGAIAYRRDLPFPGHPIHEQGIIFGMAMNKKNLRNIDDYMDRFPKEVQQLLKKMRLTIKKAAPKAKETISYGIPSFTLDGSLVWFAAFKSHIGFYPGTLAITAFKKELSPYKVGKGSIQFQFDEPLPLALVSRIVKFRVKQNLSKKKKK
jgi:uncharacterized protein YdhG (YjbR/CyaY superfamily)